MTARRLHIVADVFRRKGLQDGLSFLRNIAAARLHRVLPGLGTAFLPTAMDIEVSSVCNLRCPGCIHGHKDGRYLRPRPKFMSLSAFRQILDEAGTSLLNINMTPLGEVFLNPEIYEIITCAKDYGIRICLDTNGHFLDPKRAVASGLDEITFAVDGFSQESYSSYRRGGSLQTVLDNIAALRQEVLHTGSPIRINVKYFLNRHTESEVETARAHFSAQPEVSFFVSYFLVPPPNWEHYRSDPYSTTAELHDAWAPVVSREHDLYALDSASGLYRQITQSMAFRDSCESIRFGLYITTSGDAYPCCKAAALETPTLLLGNVLQEGLGAVFNGKSAQAIRKKYAHAGGRFSICSTCWVNRARGNRVRYVNSDFTGGKEQP